MSPGSTKKKKAGTKVVLKALGPPAPPQDWGVAIKLMQADLNALTSRLETLVKEVESIRTSKWHVRSTKHAD